ncbi:helix-turn-helix transcriptional regulator [Enterococcus ureilyticus]|uniref:helix-turn-helix domain-containing protein n=1 Tax=Enterococcus ureilyticus TaxID=1131292 RepID=UPI001A912E47|nr:helix-turn-helix transcriptional regulator [Enterococcus ureilyticus]MBO0447645.1 helix-turn-helix transcriptional regulator [Enterococcus ureilyticus]
MEQLGINIRKLRKVRGMTQEELAENARTTKQSILKIEKGETIPLSTTLYAIASSLGTTVETLFGENIELSQASENIVLDVLRRQASFNELHRNILEDSKEDGLDKVNLEKERKLLLSELDIDNLSNKKLYELILLKQKFDIENARKEYLDSSNNQEL